MVNYDQPKCCEPPIVARPIADKLVMASNFLDEQAAVIDELRQRLSPAMRSYTEDGCGKEQCDKTPACSELATEIAVLGNRISAHTATIREFLSALEV